MHIGLYKFVVFSAFCHLPQFVLLRLQILNTDVGWSRYGYCDPVLPKKITVNWAAAHIIPGYCYTLSKDSKATLIS